MENKITGSFVNCLVCHLVLALRQFLKRTVNDGSIYYLLPLGWERKYQPNLLISLSSVHISLSFFIGQKMIIYLDTRCMNNK